MFGQKYDLRDWRRTLGRDVFLVTQVVLLALTSECLGNGEKEVRVRIFSDVHVTSATFRPSGSDSLLIEADGRTVDALYSGESAVVEHWQGFLRIRWSRGSMPVDRCRIRGSGLTQVELPSERIRSYRGSFEVTTDANQRPGLRLVNLVPLDDYVASVLPSEFPFEEVEGARAQAIVIRTYAAAAIGRNGDDYALRDDEGSQVYLGAQSETDLSRRLAYETSGSVITHDGELIDAVYSSHCGGHTADNEDVWGTNPAPYLRGRKDPYDRDAPVGQWKKSVEADALLEGISARLDAEVDGFKVTDRGAGKHVRSVAIKVKNKPDRVVSGERFRSLVNAAAGTNVISSTIFEIRKKSGRYEFEGRGNGHGVGLCQWGAVEQARRGRDFEEIIAFYYRGVDISSPEPRLDLVAARAEQDEPNGHAPSSVESKQTRTRRPGW